MLAGSVANGLNSFGSFWAGSCVVVNRQRINGTSFVLSAIVMALLAASASEDIIVVRKIPSIRSKLQENLRASDPHRARMLRGAHDLLARLPVDRPHPLAFCDALRIRVREAAVVVAGVILVTIVTVAIELSSQLFEGSWWLYSGPAAESDESTGLFLYRTQPYAIHGCLPGLAYKEARK